MIFIYAFFLLALITIFLFYISYRRLHFTYSNSNSIIDAKLYGHISPSSCLAENTLKSCATDAQCSPSNCKLTSEQAKNSSFTCRPYLNATEVCASLDSCDATFCDVVYNDTNNTRSCVPRKFCQLPEPIEICNAKNGGMWTLTGVSEGNLDGNTVGESLYQCTCKYPGIAAGKGCELNPDVCYGGEWLFHADDNCSNSLTEEDCLYKNPLNPAKYGIGSESDTLSPSSKFLRRSCEWLKSPINPSKGTCVQRAPDPTLDCICPPTSYLLIKDQGAFGKQNVPICVPKNKTTCSNSKMCTQFYDNTFFPITSFQNYTSTLESVPYLTANRPPSEYIWSPSTCINKDIAATSTMTTITPTGERAPSENPLGKLCIENVGTCTTFKLPTPWGDMISLTDNAKQNINTLCSCPPLSAVPLSKNRVDASITRVCEQMCPFTQSPTEISTKSPSERQALISYADQYLQGLHITNKTDCEKQAGILTSVWKVNPDVAKLFQK